MLGRCPVRLQHCLHVKIKRRGVTMPVLRGCGIIVIVIVVVVIVSERDRVLALKPLATQPFIPLAIPQLPRSLADLTSVVPFSREPEETLVISCA